MQPEPFGYQEAVALQQARLLLVRLADHRQTPRIPRDVRAEARAVLRWLPSVDRLQRITHAARKREEFADM